MVGASDASVGTAYRRTFARHPARTNNTLTGEPNPTRQTNPWMNAVVYDVVGRKAEIMTTRVGTFLLIFSTTSKTRP